MKKFLILGFFVVICQAKIDKDKECYLAKTCIHNAREACGKTNAGQVRRFLDSCDIREYNCIKNTDYVLTSSAACANAPPLDDDSKTIDDKKGGNKEDGAKSDSNDIESADDVDFTLPTISPPSTLRPRTDTHDPETRETTHNTYTNSTLWPDNPTTGGYTDHTTDSEETGFTMQTTTGGYTDQTTDTEDTRFTMKPTTDKPHPHAKRTGVNKKRNSLVISKKVYLSHKKKMPNGKAKNKTKNNTRKNKNRGRMDKNTKRNNQ